MSTFTNITASGTITADTVVCDSFITNTALSSSTYGGSTVQTNTIIPYTGNIITINGPTAGLDTLDINSRQVLFEGNANITGTTFTKNINAGTSNITGGNLIISNNIISKFMDLSNLDIGNIVSNVNILGTTFTKNINAGTSNISGGNLIISNNIIGSFLTLSNLNAGNVISNYANINNVFIGTSASYTQSSGTALVMSQNTTFDNTVSGTISGNVYPQFSFGGGREHIFATDVNDSNVCYYGISGGGAPDSDYMITYKRAVGMKISPTYTTENFTEALRVVGTANISGNIALGGNISTVGNVYQTYTLNSPINATIHTAYIEPCLNDTSKNVIIKGESATTGGVLLYGSGVYSFTDTYIDKGLSIGTGVGLGVNGSKLISNKGTDLYGNTSVIGNLSVSTFGNIISLRGSGNSEVGYNALNRKIKMGAIDATTQRISFYCSSNITAENMNGYIEIDGETNGSTTQNRGALNMVCGNITMGTINSQSFILYNKNVEIQGNINALQALNVLGNTSTTILEYNNLYKNNIRMVDCWGAINAITILNNAYVPFGNPLVGTVDQWSSPWFRVNKQGQSLTIGCQVILSLHTGTSFTNTTTGAFQVETSTTSTFTTFTSRTLRRCLGTFAQDSYNHYILDFILPTTEEYFRVKYTGNATYTLVGGVADGYLSRYSFRTYY